MRRLWLLGALFATAAPAFAQGGETDLVRLQRQLQQNRSEVERLFDLRMRHGIGVLLEADAAEFRSPGVTAEAIEQLAKERRDQEARTSALREQHDRLRAALEQRQARASLPPERVRDEEPGDVPAAPAAETPPARQAQPAPVAAPAPVPTPAPVAPAVAPVAQQPAQPSPPCFEIRGSVDPVRIAKALFQAGEALMDRASAARAQDDTSLARELDTQARQRLQQALAHLAPVVQPEDAAFAALFTQGRTLELLFRLSERYDGLSLSGSTLDYQRREQEVRDPFLAITARDAVRTGARLEVEVLGPWGAAAQSAMEHFRWMNLHGGYSRRANIEALTWPGERDL
ncbi:MAG TPA: hypothetical protein VF384_11150 [Planctomycetota bacterium]